MSTGLNDTNAAAARGVLYALVDWARHDEAFAAGAAGRR